MQAPDVLVRPMQEADLPCVLRIQAECHAPGNHEPDTSFLVKLRATPDTCWVATMQGKVMGYLVALPALAHQPPALHADACEVPARPDCLYLHDLSVAAQARGVGLAQALLASFHAARQALGLRMACLTAVNDSARYWLGQGFVPVDGSDMGEGALASYGEGARYMRREFSAAEATPQGFPAGTQPGSFT